MKDLLTGRIFQPDRIDLDLLSSLFVDIDIDAEGSISAIYKAWLFHGIGIVRSTTHGSRFRVLRSDQHINFGSASNCIFLCFQLEGTVNLAQAGRDCILRPGEFGLLDSRHEYEIDIDDGTDSIWLKIPPERLQARGVVSLDVVARRKGNRDGIELITSKFIHSFVSQMDVLQSSETALISVLIDLVSGASADNDIPVRGGGQSLSRFLTWQRACAHIENNIADETLNPTQIASAVGISTRYLSELFAENGKSPMQWIALRRLELCLKSLEVMTWTPGVITEIAFRFGFTNVSSFNRAFKQKYGAPPRRFMLN